MKASNLPKPSPDFTRLRNVITGAALPDRLPFVDLLVDQPIKELILGRPTVSDFTNDPDEARQRIDDEIEFRYTLGYDYIDVSPFVYFGASYATSENSERNWMSEAAAVVKNRADFEQRFWPDPELVDYSAMEYAASRLPDGMTMIPRIAGVFEEVSKLTGLEGLSYLLVDDPALVGEMFDKVGGILLAIAERFAGMDRVGALFMGEDMGFNTGPLLSPKYLRQFVFPWHKKICEAAHSRNLPLLLHSCGNIELLMDDLIEGVGIDARHSFQDAVVPIETAVERYSDRIALLGGVDMDLLARGTEEQVRTRVREIIEKCAPSGRFAMGAGNSIASYLNVNNYLAMLDETRRWNS
jgi:uroporphyrinogen decarboxylase